ncbi:hypothetical protein V5799_033252 [Amblyomma americanum]|uniref:Uncharacterized protein n=1 Tax=Amblyomma americanum TaxID=6943 RepID=A0AAQ4DNU7_AMBAM
MQHCMPMANPEVEYDCDVFLHIRPLSGSSSSGSTAPHLSSPPVTSSPLSNELPKAEMLDFPFAKHWQAVFVFKGSAPAGSAADHVVVMLEAGKSSGYLEGHGFVTTREVLEMERPRKLFLRSGRFSLKTLTNALSAMNGSRSVYCLVWNNCQEWIAGLMHRLNVALSYTRFSSVVNRVLTVASLGLFAYVVYISYTASQLWTHGVAKAASQA